MSQIHNINWSITDDLDEPSLIGSNHKFSKVAFPYDAKMASGFTQHFDGLDGIVLIQDRHHFIKDECPSSIPIGKFSVKFDAPMLVLHIMHSGNIDVYSHQQRIKTFREKGFILCARVLEYEVEQVAHTNENIITTTLIIPELTMKGYIGDLGCLSFFKKIGISADNALNLLPTPIEICNELLFDFPNNLEKKMQALFIQSKIIKFIADINTYSDAEKTLLFDRNIASFKIEDVYAFLETSHGDIPTLKVLGNHFGMAPAKLNALFNIKYGESIYSFILNLRLSKAYEAVTLSDMAMKTIAFNIGYSHVNHFIYAFRKKFGITPGQLRKIK